MSRKYVSSCCCGCSLVKGATAIGATLLACWLLIMACSWFLLGYWIAKENIVAEAKEKCSQPQNANLIECQRFEQAMAHMQQTLHGFDTGDFIKTFVIGYNVLGVIGIVVCSLLIHGCRKGRPNLLLPFIIFKGTSLGISAITTIGAGLYYRNIINLSAMLPIYVLLWALMAYLVIVVISCRAEMLERRVREDKELQAKSPTKNHQFENPLAETLAHPKY